MWYSENKTRMQHNNEHNYLLMNTHDKVAFCFLVSIVNTEAYDDATRTASEWFLTWDILEDAMPFLSQPVSVSSHGLGPCTFINRRSKTACECRAFVNSGTHSVSFLADTRCHSCGHTGMHHVGYDSATMTPKVTYPTSPPPLPASGPSQDILDKQRHCPHLLPPVYESQWLGMYSTWQMVCPDCKTVFQSGCNTAFDRD